MQDILQNIYEILAGLLISLASLVGMTGTVQDLPTEEILGASHSITFNGETIDFDYTDDNTNETLIIRTDAETYGGWDSSTVYFSIENTTAKDEQVYINFLFDGANEDIAEIKEYKASQPDTVVVNDFGLVNHTCSSNWLASTTPDQTGYECNGAEFKLCDSVSGTTCTIDNDFIGTSTKTVFSDKWGALDEVAFNDALLVNRTKTVPAKYENKGGVLYSIAAGETKQFKATLNLPPQTERKQFFIECFGVNGGYGHI